MSANRRPYVHRADVRLTGGDSAGPGAAVTARLCGHWQHEGTCRWPHHTAVEGAGPEVALRVVFVAEPADVVGVRRLIVEGLAVGTSSGPDGDSRWHVLGEGPAELTGDEHALGTRLAGG